MCCLRALIVWLLLMVAEIIHGTLRTLLLAPSFGDYRARQISVFTGSAIIFVIVFFLIGWIGFKRAGTLFAVGIMWLFLALVFEISLGRFVFDYSWERIGADFNILKGGLLPLGLLILALSPLIAARVRKIGSVM
jgi:hypothetical protein